jgi:hypothetical protein
MLECTLQVFSGFVCKPISFLQISIYSAGVLLAIFFPILYCLFVYGCHFRFKGIFWALDFVLHCELHYDWDCKVRGGGST